MSKIKLIIFLVIVGLLFTALIYKDKNPDSQSELSQKMNHFLDQLMQTTQDKMPQLKEQTAKLIEEITQKMTQKELAEFTSGFASDSTQSATGTENVATSTDTTDEVNLNDPQMKEGFKLIIQRLKEMNSDELVEKVQQHIQMLNEQGGSNAEDLSGVDAGMNQNASTEN